MSKGLTTCFGKRYRVIISSLNFNTVNLNYRKQVIYIYIYIFDYEYVCLFTTSVCSPFIKSGLRLKNRVGPFVFYVYYLYRSALHERTVSKCNITTNDVSGSSKALGVCR